MRSLTWLIDACLLAAWMTGCAMFALLAAANLSNDVRQFGYGDDWLINANPLAALVALVVGIRLRKRWWFKIIALSVPGFFLWQMWKAHGAINEAHSGLGKAFGRVFEFWLMRVTGVTFIACFVVTALVLGWFELRRQQQKSKRRMLPQNPGQLALERE
jgi:preprotein translocase subunit SecG